MNALTWSNNLWRNELAEPADVSIPSLAAYYRYNVNDLNTLLGTTLSLNTQTLELNDSQGNLIDDEAAAIYKYLYLVKYYERQIRNFLGVGSVNIYIVNQVSDNFGGNMKFVDRNQIARTYLQLRKDTYEILKSLVNKYKFSKQTAVDVQGSDIFVKPGSVYQAGVQADGVLYQQDIL